MSRSKSYSALAIVLAVGCQEDYDCMHPPPPVEESVTIQAADGAAIHVHARSDLNVAVTATNRAAEPCGFAVYIGVEPPIREHVPVSSGTAPAAEDSPVGFLAFDSNIPGRRDDRVFASSTTIPFDAAESDANFVTFAACEAPDLDVALEGWIIDQCQNFEEFPGEIEVLW